MYCEENQIIFISISLKDVYSHFPQISTNPCSFCSPLGLGSTLKNLASQIRARGKFTKNAAVSFSTHFATEKSFSLKAEYMCWCWLQDRCMCTWCQPFGLQGPNVSGNECRLEYLYVFLKLLSYDELYSFYLLYKKQMKGKLT